MTLYHTFVLLYSRVDDLLRVKVADFGLSRDVYHSDYYRLTHKARLPVKWMPPESLFRSMYSEKTDVVGSVVSGCEYHIILSKHPWVLLIHQGYRWVLTRKSLHIKMGGHLLGTVWGSRLRVLYLHSLQ